MNKTTNQNVETNNEKNNLDENDINEILLRESLRIPDGWYEEVYYNKETNSISFSSPMTGNTWTESKDVVGGIESMDFSDLEGWKTIDDEFVEVDDGQNETDPNFTLKEYERYYEDSSIISVENAIDIISSFADEETWYSEIKENIEKQEEGVEQ